MCKLFSITNLERVAVNEKLLSAIKHEVCKADKDGFGYAVVDTVGAIGGELTTRPKEFVPFQGTNTKVSRLKLVEKASSRFGKVNLSKAKSLIAHGRYSTNSVSLENTHPFFNGTTALAHNGVVSDEGREKLTGLETDNDTEILFRRWTEGGVTDVQTMVGGYFAFLTLETDGTVHVVRDDRATLYVSWSDTIDSWIIATTSEIVTNVAKKMRWKLEAKPYMLKDNVYGIFDRNELVMETELVRAEFRRESPMNSTERKALGYTSTYEPLDDREPIHWKDLEKYEERADELSDEPYYRRTGY